MKHRLKIRTRTCNDITLYIGENHFNINDEIFIMWCQYFLPMAVGGTFAFDEFVEMQLVERPAGNIEIDSMEYCENSKGGDKLTFSRKAFIDYMKSNTYGELINPTLLVIEGEALTYGVEIDGIFIRIEDEAFTTWMSWHGMPCRRRKGLCFKYIVSMLFDRTDSVVTKIYFMQCNLPLSFIYNAVDSLEAVR